MIASVLVTGSSGFVGYALSERLGERMLPCDLRIDRPISAIVCSPEFNSVDTVVHCAAVQLFTPGQDLYRYETFQRTNVAALELLLERSQQVGVRKFIHISTDMVYGVPTVCPVTESCPLLPVGFYGYSKALAEETVLKYASSFPVVTILRPRIIGGPGRGGLFKTLARAIQMGLPLPLFGDGRNPFQMLHVDDLVDLIMECIERDVPGVFNVGSESVTTIRAKIAVIAKILGRRVSLVSVPEKLAVSFCQTLYRLRLGMLHPEQFLTAGRPFVLSLEKTFAHFEWRPLRSDDQVIADTMQPDHVRILNKPSPSANANLSNNGSSRPPAIRPAA